MIDWSWHPDSKTRTAIRHGDVSYRDYQRRISERLEAERRIRRERHAGMAEAAA